MDYNFISVGEFRELDENGLLLESGTYDGRCRSHTSQPAAVEGHRSAVSQWPRVSVQDTKHSRDSRCCSEEELHTVGLAIWKKGSAMEKFHLSSATSEAELGASASRGGLAFDSIRE